MFYIKSFKKRSLEFQSTITYKFWYKLLPQLNIKVNRNEDHAGILLDFDWLFVQEFRLNLYSHSHCDKTTIKFSFKTFAEIDFTQILVFDIWTRMCDGSPVTFKIGLLGLVVGFCFGYDISEVEDWS